MRKGHTISLIKDTGLGKKINKCLKCMSEYLPNELGRTTVNFQRVGSGGTQVKNFRKLTCSVTFSKNKKKTNLFKTCLIIIIYKISRTQDTIIIIYV